MKLKEWQTVLNEQRLPHQLKLQSNQIDRAFGRHELNTQVSGGKVNSQTIQFDLNEQIEAGKEMLVGIKNELLALFGVSAIKFSRLSAGLRLHVEHQAETAVRLTELISILDDVGAETAVIGLNDEGQPLLHQFSSERLSHILIQGNEGAGKSSLLRSIAVSLAMLNRQSQLQLVLFSPDKQNNSVLKPLAYLPHLLVPVVASLNDCQEMLSFLEDEMQYRMQQGSANPTIVLLIDDVELLLQMPHIVNQLLNLLQNGPDNGIHLVLSHVTSESTPFPEMLKGNIPFRIVGQLPSPEVARLVTDLIDSQAEHLQGRGDFITISGETVLFFQGASINDYDLHLVLDKLHRYRPRSILAYPFKEQNSSPDFPAKLVENSDEKLEFSIEGHAFSIKKENDEEIPFDIGLPPDPID